ncbi:TadE/TadG family type IV pilus assembly protein [Methylobacterium sp. WSM2598]|uniref:TadE/TadG family type IV pilus assembly protein n=1 Tax=Methylobacterium sp. WSM2598 TaxID=398261 RepID=UPI00039E6621|nr:TadE/TadG family type IV pilus assembly protein [Methylobacterium sp. WSM2598]
MRRGRAGAGRPGARLWGDAAGVAAIEFAAALPVLLVVMAVGLQVALYVNAKRSVERLARTISQMISQAVPPAGAATATVNAADIRFGFDAAIVLFPYVLADAARQGIPWQSNIAINAAGIAFTKVASGCSDPTDQSACYVANVVWTSSGTGGSTYRPCLVAQQPAGNAAPPSPTTLPRSVFGPASLVVVDVVFTFRPTFGATYVRPRGSPTRSTSSPATPRW